jgi:single-stranded-DNA-specific exonuclease
LRELRNPVQPGLRALMQIAQIPPNRAPTAAEIGFRLAPRINAAGRMDVASDVVDLFLTKDPEHAIALAGKLNRLNEDRRATEAAALEAIERQLTVMHENADDSLAQCIVLDDPDWHRGVLGILASRVVDRTGRPALVLTHEDGQAHGSGRSIDGFHLLDALTAIHSAGLDLFTRFGGHAHAVGFSLPSEHIAALRQRMQIYGETMLTGPTLFPPLACDAEVEFSELTSDFFNWLTRSEPFGVGHREPVWISRGLVLSAPVRLIKEKHICLELAHASSSQRFSALGWSRSIDWPAHCVTLGLERGSTVDAAYRLKAKSNPQYPGLELELVALRRTSLQSTSDELC